MDAVEGVQHLVEYGHHLLFGKWCGGMLDLVAQTLSFDEIHHIIGCAILFEQVVHRHEVCIVEMSQTVCLVVEPLPLTLEKLLVGFYRHNDGMAILVTTAESTEEVFLDGHALVETCQRGLISDAETALSKYAGNDISAILQLGSGFQCK